MASLRKLDGRGMDDVAEVPEGTWPRVSDSHDVTICLKKCGRNSPRCGREPGRRKMGDARKLSQKRKRNHCDMGNL